MADKEENILLPAVKKTTALVPTEQPVIARDPEQGSRVLIVDNEPSHAEAMAECLFKTGYKCTVATSGQGGFQLLDSEVFDIIITDQVMNDIDGLELLAKAKEEQPDAEVIVVTGHGSVPEAVSAMQQGAFNYMLKPLDVKQLRAIVDRAAESVILRRTNADLRRRLDEKFGFEGLVGSSPPMQKMVEKLKRVSPTNARVLILGETGTGKELVAQAVHQNSKRKKKPFVALNCAALSETILESELFGHMKGAFTDATSDRVGKFEYAHGGTLFLDEVGDMPMSTQIKLLRVIETGEITRVGSNEPIKVDVRIISATNRSLEEGIKDKSFREDLYHRLKVVTVRIPKLSDRAQDIPLLTDHFVKEFSKSHDRVIRGISPNVLRSLMTYSWPGNVRELRNVVETMVVLDQDSLLDVDDLPDEMSEAPELLTINDMGLHSLVGKPLRELEKLFIKETLESTNGNREKAAKLLGIGERTLYRKIRDFEL